jgi:imidazolonepropionase-like amidohydrolase
MLVVKNGKLLTMTGIEYNNGYVVAEKGKIITIGKYSDLPESLALNNEEAVVIDAKGGYIVPGLIDAHCHVGMWEDSTGFEGEDGNEMTDPVTPHLRAIDGVYYSDRGFVEARENGVTTIVTGPGSANVIGGQFAALKTWGRRVEDMIIKEPVAMKAAFGENPKTVYHERKQMPTTRMATAALLRENLTKAKEYGKQLVEYKKDSENNEKPEYDIKLEALLKVINREIPLKAHAHREDDILTAIRIAKEFGIRITIEHCTEGHLIADILANENIIAIVGPSLTDRSKVELKNLSLKTPGVLSKAGVTVAIMTDHPVIPIQYLSLCAALAVREGMDEKEALKAITINAAYAAGIDDRVGSLEPGKDADIIVYDGHPFELKSKVLYTVINGEIVYKREE